MGKAPAFQFYANDFMDATRLWDANACGLYIRCICIQWTHGSIPADLKLLARAIHCDRQELESCWEVIGPKFIDQGDGNLKNSKLEEVRTRQKEVSEERSKAANARWKVDANANANAMQKDMQRKVKEKEKEKEKDKVLEERKEPKNLREEFRSKCASAAALLSTPMPKEERAAFLAYWTETSPSGQMRFQAQKFFDHKRRMETWMRNNANKGAFGKPAEAAPSPTAKPWIQ